MNADKDSMSMVMCVALDEYTFRHKCTNTLDQALSTRPASPGSMNRSSLGDWVVVTAKDLTGHDYRVWVGMPCFNKPWQLERHPAKQMVGHYHDPNLVFIAEDFIKYCENQIPFTQVRSAAMIKARPGLT